MAHIAEIVCRLPDGRELTAWTEYGRLQVDVNMGARTEIMPFPDSAELDDEGVGIGSLDPMAQSVLAEVLARHWRRLSEIAGKKAGRWRVECDKCGEIWNDSHPITESRTCAECAEKKP